MGKKEEQAFQKWAKDFGSKLPENLRNSWTAVVENEYEGKEELMNGFLRQSDYTLKTTELADARKAAEAEVLSERAKREAYEAQVNDWYSKANQEYIAQQQKLIELEGKLSHTESPSNFGRPTVEQTELLKQIDMLKKQNTDLVDHVRKVDLGTANAVTAFSSLAYKALKEGYSYDPNAILKISQTKGVPLDIAFNEFTQAEREAKQKAALEAERNQMREEIRKEILSNRPTPDAMGPDNPVLGTLFSKQQGTHKSDYEVVQDAVRDFNEGFAGSR